jgi:hypothetical protein
MLSEKLTHVTELLVTLLEQTLGTELSKFL